MKTLLRLMAVAIGLAPLTQATAQPTLLSPTNQTASLGGTATFRVHALSGSPPYAYEWYHDDVLINPAANATAATRLLVITNATLVDAGQYHAVVTDTNGPATSDSATLEVDPTFSLITQGQLVTDLEGSVTGTWIDYDQDGYLDLFVGNSGGLVLNSLYRNNGDDSFSKVLTNAIATVPGNAWGVGWADYDNDGKPDLFVANVENRNDALFHNQGGGQFVQMTSGPLVSDALDSVMGLWGDYDRDGFLDLFLSTGYWSGGQHDRLYHNEANGSFRVTTVGEVGDLVADRTSSHSYGWNDYDEDGDLDLFVVYATPNSERGTNFVFRNSLNGPFERIALPAFDAAGGWGPAWGDYDNDGRLDLFMPGWLGTNALFKNLEGAEFADVSEASGLRLKMASNASAWADYDNDGWLDLVVGNYQGIAGYPGGHALFRNNRDGTFTQIVSGSIGREGGKATAVACGDYDNNGFQDLYFVCGDGLPQRNILYRNNGNSNHWLKVRLDSQVSNRLGIGAKIRLQAQIDGQTVTQTRVITAQHSWIGDNGLIAHFGLGDATSIDLLRIEWPSGNVQELENVAPDQMLTVTESVGITPVRPSASLNGSVTLAMSPLGGAGYQWRFEGVDLPGQISRILTLTNITADQEGLYSVVASNATTLTTNFMYLAVDTTFTKITEGPVVEDVGVWVAPTWWDYDGDDFLDLYVPQGTDGTSALYPDALYHNERDGTFSRVSNAITALLGLSTAGPVADFDNDGDLDLAAIHPNGADDLYRNEGGGLFTRLMSGQGEPPFFGLDNSADGCWADYDRDGFVDLFAANWTAPVLSDCLYRNNHGDGTFTKMTANEVGMLVADGVKTGPCAWVDYDNDHWPDLWVTASLADLTPSDRQYLWHNNGDGTFSEMLANSPYRNLAKACGTWGDYDNDGFPDLFVSSWVASTSALLRNFGGQSFTNVAASAGLNLNMEGWTAGAWGDYDNDGFLDLFVPAWAGRSYLYRNNGNGTFTSVDGGNLVRDGDGDNRVATAWADYDNDGFLDLLIACGNFVAERNLLYHNNGNSNHWLKVRLVGTTSNRSGIGAKVRVRAVIGGASLTQTREISGNSGFTVGTAGLLAHFGIGNATTANLRIEWPSGTVQELTNVAANQMLTIVEPRRPVMNGAFGPDGSFQIEVTTENGLNYELQASNDLGSWTTNESYTGTGEVMRLTPIAPAEQYRFYRVVSP